MTEATLAPPAAVPRAMPVNIAAEQELLGAILVNNDAWMRVSDILAPEDFADTLNGDIYRTMSRILDGGGVVTATTLQHAFPETATAGDGRDPRSCLAGLAARALYIINARDYALLLRDLSLKRALLSTCETLVNDVHAATGETSAESLIETAEARLFRLGERGQAGTGLVDFHSALGESVEMVSRARERGGISGVATGLVRLDRLLGGLHASDLVILAGRPSMGKTSLATCIAASVARAFVRSGGTGGGRVAFFSLEMSAEQLATRLLAMETGIASSDLRRGEISDEDFSLNLVPAVRELSSLPLSIDETPGISLAQMRSRARRLKRSRGLDLLFVDYLQLMRADRGVRHENRVHELSDITRGLKALAKELAIPVVALSQLSRAVETREDKRPQLADLRDSGAIEQDADVVLFVFREEYYEARREPGEGTPEHAEWRERMERIYGRAEVIVSKQRHGPIGTVPLAFHHRLTRFANLATSPEEAFPGQDHGTGQSGQT